MKVTLVIGCYLVLLLLPFSFFGQQKTLSLTIKDSSTKKEVGYASIRTSKKNIYADANEQGYASIDVAEHDTLEIGRIGYYSKRILCNLHMNEFDVYLTPKIDTLRTIVIKPFRTNWSYSNFKEKTHQTINYSNDTVLSQVAVKIHLPKNVKGIKINQVKFRQNAFAQNFLRLHFFSVNELGLPGDELLNEIIIIQPSHFSNGTLSIPLNDIGLYIDDTSFFVGIQWLTKKDPIKVSHKTDIGLSVTNESSEPQTYYQNFGVGRNWHQLFSNGIRIYNDKNGSVIERKILPLKPIGMASNLKIEIDGMLY